jgi:hypothetical protein
MAEIEASGLAEDFAAWREAHGYGDPTRSLWAEFNETEHAERQL